MRNGKTNEEMLEDCQIPVSAMYEERIKKIRTYYDNELKHWRISFLSCFIALMLVSAIAVLALFKLIGI